MSSLALLLTLTAALLHAIWNVAAKRATGRAVFGFQTALASAIIWAPIAFTEIYRFQSTSVFEWNTTSWLIVLASSIIHVVYFLCLLQGYRIAPMSVVYPVARGTGPLISFFIAIFVFTEPLTLSGFCGMILILVGVFIISQPTKNRAIGELINSKEVRVGILWGTITGLFIAAYTIIDAYAVKTVSLRPIQYHFFMNLLMIPFYFWLAKDFKKSLYPTKTQLRSIFTLAILGPAGYLLILYAVQIAPVSHVAPAREVSMMFAAILGGRFLREGDFLRRTLAAAVIVAGVWLLAS